MPQMGPMVGYAVTVVIEPSNAAHRETNPNGGNEYRRYIASIPGPKIVVRAGSRQTARLGSAWGEVSATCIAPSAASAPSSTARSAMSMK
jgi:4-hydroxy-4-methyl-2-oxoglutarate aldolase